MLMASGRLVYPHNSEAPSLEDIGQGLAGLIRFGAQTPRKYSVLCHTLAGLRLAPGPVKIHWLLHDAPEVCCADVPSPWKTEAAIQREAILLERIYAEHGLELPSDTVRAAVKSVDYRLCVAEAKVLGHDDWEVIAAELHVDLDDEAMRATRSQLGYVMPYLTDSAGAARAYVSEFHAAVAQAA